MKKIASRVLAIILVCIMAVGFAVEVQARGQTIIVTAYHIPDATTGQTHTIPNMRFGLYNGTTRLHEITTDRHGSFDFNWNGPIEDLDMVVIDSLGFTSEYTRFPLSEFRARSSGLIHSWRFNLNVTPPVNNPPVVNQPAPAAGTLTVIGGSNPQVVLNGNVIQGASAVIVDGTTLVPVRVISESLGATVTWDGAARQVGIEVSPGDVVGLTIGSTAVQGRNATLLQAPVIRNDLTHVPLRFIGELLGLEVGFQPGS